MDSQNTRQRICFVVLVLCLTASARETLAQSRPDRQSGDPGPKTLVSTSASVGRLQVVAEVAETAVVIDGALDDPVWQRASPATGFVQSEPSTGEPATERTEVRIAYDSDNLYIGAYCYDSEPDSLVVNQIREDFTVGDQDSFEVIFDTFADRRNGFTFMTNPGGARSDEQMANEGRETNASWDAVWFVATRRVADGWTAELAIPFKSLRFDLETAPSWGINFGRHLRRKNEVDYWSPVPRAYALSRVSLAGDLVGLPAVSSGKNLKVKPFAVASSVRPAGEDEFGSDVAGGVDVKYGITPALTLDGTFHPDFAQVEADEQQVNLTQFSQFFPEKREFFLENSGIFYVGDTARNSRITATPTADTDLLLFFSRRIGLTPEGFPIPIVAGARLTGNLAGLRIGALNVQTERTEREPANNFTIVRLRRDILRNSDVGAIFMTRQSTDDGSDYNRVYGLDATLRLFGNADWASYFVRTATPGFTDGQYALRSTINREGNFFHIKSGIMFLGDHFNDELGFYNRIGVRKYLLDTGIRPRFESLQRRGIREMHPHVVWDYFTDHSGTMVAKRLHTGYSVFFNNGGFTELSVNPEFQLLIQPFKIHPDAPPIPVGGYSWVPVQLRFNSDPSQPVSFNLTGIWGGLWSGTQKTLQATVTLQPSYRFRLSVGTQRTNAKLEVPETEFVSSISTLRANYSFSANMFLDSLLQYDRDRDQVNVNVRFNFMHHPMSDLFIVYNEQRFVTVEDPIPTGRGFIVKFTQLFSF